MSLRSPLQNPLRSVLRSPLAPRVTGAAGALTPIAGMAIWLRKGTASGASWPDASGNARNMTLVGSPTIGASTVTFNGTTQYGTIAASGLTGTVSIYLRFKQVAWAASARVVSSSLPRLIQSASSPNIALIDSDATPYATNGNAEERDFASLGFAQSGGTSVININGTETADDAAGDSWATFALAASSAGASPSNIEVVEVVLYNVAHSPEERTQMIAYLAAL